MTVSRNPKQQYRKKNTVIQLYLAFFLVSTSVFDNTYLLVLKKATRHFETEVALHRFTNGTDKPLQFMKLC